MQCPPGKVFNPMTGRCVLVTGKAALHAYRQGYVGAAEAQQAYAAVQQYGYQPKRRTRKQYAPAGLAGAFGANVRHTRVAQAPALGRAPVLIPDCKAGYERNPDTGRCIKVGGRTHKRRYPIPSAAGAGAGTGAGERANQNVRRISSEGPIAIPLGKSGIAPIADKAAILGWAGRNCKHKNDALTGKRFVDESPIALQTLVRLHDGSCVTASALDAAVSAQHKKGEIATIPGGDHLTLEDFHALRDTMRRTAPGYKIPQRKHQPPPPEWQLYVATDERSGAGFASVLYVDITKARTTATGVEYPIESIRVDLGFIPTTGGGRCSPQNVVDHLQYLAASNRLLTPVAGGWKPVAGFPFGKKYWESDRALKLDRLCRDLEKFREVGL